MPGIYGFTTTQANNESGIDKMSKAMNLYPNLIQDMAFKNDKIAASRIHLGHVGEIQSPQTIGGISVWIEGESYNLDEVWAELNYSGEINLARGLIQAYEKMQLDSFLKKIDGFFCAVIYDENSQKINLISDRYGMRFLYWYFNDNQFIWSSEIKSILELNKVDKTIDKNSLDCFMDLGYLLGEHTWFEHIKLIEPATIIEFDINTKKCKQHNYWEWSDIKPSAMSFEDAVDELGVRFVKAVERRFTPNEGVGIALSGGLDSRAIFAAVNHLHPGHSGYTYTFGTPKCDDITIAEQVISTSNWQHQLFHFTDSNWFESRIDKVWNTDGMQDMMHMHGSEFLNEISKRINVNLNGYSGDVILGGGFLNKTPLNRRASEENIKSFFGKHVSLIDVDNSFYDIDKVEPILQMNRVRRFTAMGTVNSLISVEQRKPFFDNAIVELIYSLPDEYRLNNKLYSAMLNKKFPEFFRSIPWQQTGKPVDVLSPPSIPTRAVNKLFRIISQLLGIKSDKEYVNYNQWVRSPDVMGYLEALLSDKDSIYRTIKDIDFCDKYLLPHKKSSSVNKSNEILRAATIEIYLRMVNKMDLPKKYTR